jgi:LacI family transcriptional regulator, repressor for deo operon, udp, cdd, tsx, nupC, and nupG
MKRLVEFFNMRTSENNLVTMRDIADLAGVSPGTVSRALKNQSGLTEQTRQLILRCASELGYNALNLRSNKLKRVGFVTSRLPNLAINPFYAPILHGVEDACHDEEIALSYISLRPGDRVAEIVRRHEADGLLCVGHLEPKLLERIAALGLPFVLIDHWAQGIASVNIDNLDGAKQAVQHLVGAGYKRIAFIGDSHQYPIKTRLFSFRHTLYEQGILSDPTLEVSPETPYTRAGIEAAVHGLLNLKPRPDAFFIPNDESAVWAIQICLEAGLRVPEDIAIVGFDDIDAASHTNPGLTTVRVDKELLGRTGLELLLSRNTSEIVVKTELIVRASTTNLNLVNGF